MEAIQIFYKKYKYQIFLVISAITNTFSLGRFNISILILIWPLLLIRYMRQEENKKKRVLYPIICIIFGNLFKWIGYTDYAIWADFFVGIYFSVISIIPILIFGLLIEKVSRLRQIILFPLLISSTEFLFAFIPISNVNLYGFSQVNNLIILQMINLFGIYSLSFIIGLFSSLMDYSIDEYLNNKEIYKGIYIYIGIIIFFYIYGGITIQILPKNEKIKIVNVSGISNIDYLKDNHIVRPLTDYLNYIKYNVIKAKAIDAQIITFGEESFYFYDIDYNEFINEICKIAKNYTIFISAGLDIIIDENKEKYSNENVFINDEGEVIYEYVKHNPIPLVELGYKRGMHKLKFLNTKYGKITNVICFDLNFPYYMNYIGLNHPDIVIAPSWDYEGVEETQAMHARLRVIENGYNLIKNTVAGVTVAYDFLGRFLTYYRTNEKDDYFVVSDVYCHGRKTLFSFIGVFFNYFYIIGLFFVIFYKNTFN